MKKLILVLLAIVGFSFASAAQADVPATPTSLCQQGSAVAACPNGVPSNVSASVADTYSRYNTNGQSVSGQIGGNTSVGVATSASGNQSVAAPKNGGATSVAWSQAHSSDSVASNGGFSSNSVAGSSASGSSTSVVH